MAVLAMFGQSVLNAQLDEIKDNATKLGLCKNFLRSDDFATTDGKVIASVAIDSANNDNSFWGARTDDDTTDAAAPNRRQACDAVALDSATGESTAEELCIVLLSATEVLAVADETSDRNVVIGDDITTFGFYIQATQPLTV
jgi:hypothetical protein